MACGVFSGRLRCFNVIKRTGISLVLSLLCVLFLSVATFYISFKHVSNKVDFNRPTVQTKSAFQQGKANDTTTRSVLYYTASPTSLEENERNYYTINQTNYNPYLFNFTIVGKNICSGAEPYLLILIPSQHNHLLVRKHIRNTWGQLAEGHTWPNVKVSQKVKLVFLFGRSEKREENSLIEMESNSHQDIVQADFLENYKNLSRKILMGLHWVSLHCKGAKFILKVDEDVFVHIPNLLKLLEKETNVTGDTDFGYIIGHIHGKSKVMRSEGNKWHVPQNAYPMTLYPRYAAGNSYVLPGKVAKILLRLSDYMPYVPVEDVFITGILARLAGIGHIHSPQFTYWLEGKPNACDFVGNGKISRTRVKEDLMLDIWKVLSDKNPKC